MINLHGLSLLVRQSLVVGSEEASSALDQLASQLRAQLFQTHRHRARAHDTHAHTVRRLTSGSLGP